MYTQHIRDSLLQVYMVNRQTIVKQCSKAMLWSNWRFDRQVGHLHHLDPVLVFNIFNFESQRRRQLENLSASSNHTLHEKRVARKSNKSSSRLFSPIARSQQHSRRTTIKYYRKYTGIPAFNTCSIKYKSTMLCRKGP